MTTVQCSGIAASFSLLYRNIFSGQVLRINDPINQWEWEKSIIQHILPWVNFLKSECIENNVVEFYLHLANSGEAGSNICEI